MPFDYTSGNPDNLVGGQPARMQDIQGPFYDVRAWLNSPSGGGGAGGGLVPAGTPNAPVADIGQQGQIRAGRQLVLADFTALGLSAPAGLWNLGDTTDVSGNGRALVNKGAVPFGVGINGLSTTAAVFAGSTGQALYISDTGAADPFRIKTGSWGCWFRTAKRGADQYLIAKWGGTVAVAAWSMKVASSNVVRPECCTSGSFSVDGVSDVCDDRWHFAVATYDGNVERCYVDGVLEAMSTRGADQGALNPANTPVNIGGFAADGATAASIPHYGRVDEAFVTADVLTDDQVRLLYCAKLAHTLGAVPTRARLNVTRRRRGTALVVADFPAAPVRLHNFTAGSLNDEGTGGVALSNNGSTPIGGADGTPNSAFNFTGNSSLSATDAGLPSGTAARSYGCWFKTTSTITGCLVSWGTTQNVRILVVTGAIRSDSGADLISGPYVADGQWHHAVVVEDNAAGDGIRRKLYLDGRLVGGSTVLNSITLVGANHLGIGREVDNSLPITGQIDTVFVYAGALTMEQVAALYNKATQPLTPSPKEHGAHVEGWDNSFVYTTFDTLDSQSQVDLAVAA